MRARALFLLVIVFIGGGASVQGAVRTIWAVNDG